LSWKRTLKALVQLTRSEQGHPQLDQVAQCPVQPGLECFQGQDFHHISGQPVPVTHHLHCRRLFPSIQPVATLFQFETISPCPITTEPAKESVSFFLIFLPNLLKICIHLLKKKKKVTAHFSIKFFSLSLKWRFLWSSAFKLKLTVLIPGRNTAPSWPFYLTLGRKIFGTLWLILDFWNILYFDRVWVGCQTILWCFWLWKLFRYLAKQLNGKRNSRL